MMYGADKHITKTADEYNTPQYLHLLNNNHLVLILC